MLGAAGVDVDPEDIFIDVFVGVVTVVGVATVVGVSTVVGVVVSDIGISVLGGIVKL